MKTIRKRIINYLINKLEPRLTIDQLRIIEEIKSGFVILFDGVYDEDPVIVGSRGLIVLGITKLEFEFNKDNSEVNLTIMLSNPGLLIGKQGETLNKVKNCLNTENYKVNIKLVEFNLFK